MTRSAVCLANHGERVIAAGRLLVQDKEVMNVKRLLTPQSAKAIKAENKDCDGSKHRGSGAWPNLQRPRCRWVDLVVYRNAHRGLGWHPAQPCNRWCWSHRSARVLGGAGADAYAEKD